jgi:hypothetical protein
MWKLCSKYLMTIYRMIYFDSNKTLMVFEFNVKLKDEKKLLC